MSRASLLSLFLAAFVSQQSVAQPSYAPSRAMISDAVIAKNESGAPRTKSFERFCRASTFKDKNGKLTCVRGVDFTAASNMAFSGDYDKGALISGPTPAGKRSNEEKILKFVFQ
jgi:hypothetical protein